MPDNPGVAGQRPATVEIPPSRFNPTDATLWDIERDPSLRTTIVAVLHLDRPVEHDRLRVALEAASRIVPRLRQRVVEAPAGVGAPHWELDPTFDIDRHVSFVDAPDGVDTAVIERVAAPMAASGFDRSIPLWECVHLGGSAGAAALVMKVHHSLTDGVGGMELLDALLDRERDAPPRDLTELPVPRPGRASSSGLPDLGRAARAGVEVQRRLISTAATAFTHPQRVASDAWKGVRSTGRLLAPSAAPLSTLMTERSADRRIGTVDLDLERLHRAVAPLDCTVNHAFFAGVIGGLAEYHVAKGRPTDRLRVTMPVSFRRSDDDAAGNQWAPVRMVVPADVDDPIDRMFAMRRLVRSARREPALSFSQSLAGAVQMLPSVLSSAVVGGMMHGVDLTLTNVPGLTEPHYLCGAEVERIHSFAPTAGAALNVALVSHLDRACIGLLCDAAAVDDHGLLRDLVAEHLEGVVSAAEGPSSSGPRAEPAPPRPPERLSALDTGFLRLETTETPMHIGGVFVLDGSALRDGDGRIRLDDVRRHVEARVRRLPRFGRRISEVPLGLGRPLWVDDERFDISRHVRLASVAPPGGRQDLLDLAAELFETPLDRSRPLWELSVVDGLADGRVGLIEKVHHALIDGVSGIELAAALFDAAPDHRPETPVPTEAAPAPGAMRRLVDALAEQAGDPITWAQRTANTLWTNPGELVERASQVAAAVGDMVDPSSRTSAAPFNRPIGRRRILRDTVLDLGLVDRVRHAAGATVNDVVLACVAGALRQWFEEEGLAPPDSVQVLVPVSTRRHGMTDEPGNHVGSAFVPLPVAEPDLRRRLDLVRRRMSGVKASHEGEGASVLLDALDHLPALGYGPLIRLVAVQPYVNLVVTNVPGPHDPLFFLGARVEEMVPIVPLGPRLGLGIAVLSYTDRLTVSVSADPDTCDHVHELDELAALLTG
jgi:diacylglycerol O-acyltransferase